jgi:glycosyltransferase involved in cell wall biosynthesis
MNTPYVVISPVRDEAEHLELTIRSMLQQTVRPVRWVVVDDGSTDGTSEIIDRWAANEPWIIPVHRRDRGCRKAGGGVVEAFFDGYERLAGVQWDYIVKLDGDLSFPKDYFECCFQEFLKDASLGIGGGALYNVSSDGSRFEPHPWFHVRGATKIYRERCWKQIGGIWTGPGWDTIDEVKANMLGWRTRTFAAISAFHHRMTGGAEGGWRDNIKNGRGNYAAGYHPVYVLARCIRRARRRPYIVGSVGMCYGFLSAYWKRTPRIEDVELIRYIRQQQINRLLGRKTIWM